MIKFGVVPELVDSVPPKEIKVSYPQGLEVLMGNVLTPMQVIPIPSVNYEAEEGSLYTLLMTDPDAPSKQNKMWGEARHWLVVNIPGNDVSKGQTVIEYVGSGPPKDTGLHRYIFFVFKQKETIKTDVFIDKDNLEDRLRTKTRDLIKEYNLEEPVAGNFFEAEHDVEYAKLMSKK
ncbi:PEBP1.2 family protein [Megaselia abdita]